MVTGLILDPADRAAIHRAIGRRVPVRICERVDVLRSLVAASDVRVVVSELRDRAGASVIPVLGEAGARAAAPAMLVRTQLADEAAGDVIRFAAARIPALVTFRELAAAGDPVLAALGGPGEPRADLIILERVGPLIPRPLRAFAVLCVTSPPRLHVARAATLLGVAGRTIESRLDRAALPAAHRIISWCAALHAAWELDVLGRRPKQVAARLGYASGAALANLLARYCGCSATSLREHGGFQAQLERFAALFEAAMRAT